MNRERIKKLSPYLLITGIILGIFAVIFFCKGIYPFGENSLIWGDMHDQITAFYYHFYDSFRGNNSLLINFSTSSGINFLGIFAYYLLSPISFILLLFPREHLYQAISLLIVFKVLLSGLTCLYFIKTIIKKTPHYISVLLAILYAFMGYNILLYQITSWIDIVYLFPLLLIGLKKVLDLKRPIWYLLILTLCFIFSFYLTGILLFFVFFSSFFYLYFFKDKSTHKKAILNLGIATILALLLSSFIVIPTLSEISVSSRMGFDISTLLNSKAGPLNDKLSFFITSGLSIALTILLFVKGSKIKKHHKMLGFIGCNIILLLLPVFVEPINKLWHLGSYAFFPLRIGFVLLLLFILASLYYLMKVAKERVFPKDKIKWAVLVSIAAVISLIVITTCNFSYLQHKIFGISLGSNIQVVITLLIMTLITGGSICLIFYFNKFNHDKKTFVFVWVIALTNIICSSFLYFGINFAQKSLTGSYKDMQLMEQSYQKNDYMRVKDIYPKLVMNSGMVTKYHTLDHFTSLTDKNNMEFLKKIGYSSYWVKTYSIGGSLFTDALLANQYLISKEKVSNPYYQYKDTYGNIMFYENKLDIPYGYFIKENKNVLKLDNSFLIQNEIYKGITGSTESLFTIDNTEWYVKNLVLLDEDLEKNSKTEETIEEKNTITYEVLKPERVAYLEKKIRVDKKENLYLELLRSVDNATNKGILESTNIYINGHLLIDKYPKEIDNGLLDLGIFENEEVVIRIEFNRSTSIQVVEVARMRIDLYEKFINENTSNLNINYDSNKIKVNVESNGNNILFLPVAYNEGYSVTVNGKTEEMLKLYDNYIGVKTQEGVNDIVITFTPPGLKTGVLISIGSLLLTLILFLTPLYNKLLNSKLLSKIAYYTYLVGYGLLIVGMYLLPLICFILSFFIKIKF